MLDKILKDPIEITKRDDISTWKEAHETFMEIQEILGTSSKDDIKNKLLPHIRNLKEIYDKFNKKNNKLMVSEELKYAYILYTFGSICHFCYKNNICDNFSADRVKEIFKTIMENVLVKSRDKLPNEYEILKERLIDEWNLSMHQDLKKAQIEKLTRCYPLSAIHRKNLGDYYFYKESNYTLARNEFKRALQLDPDDSKIRFKIAVTYIKEAEQSTSDRDLMLEQSDIYFSHAFNLSQDDIYKIRILFWRGYASILRNDKEQIITFFKTAQSMARANSLDMDEDLIITHEIANAYLESKRYNEAKLEFSYLINKLDKNINDKTIGTRLGLEISLRDIAAMARLSLASSYIDRDVSLDEASLLLDEACYIIKRMKNDAEKFRMFKALFFGCKGWLEFKKYKILKLSESFMSNTSKISNLKIDSTIELSYPFLLKDAFIFPAKGNDKIELRRTIDNEYLLGAALLSNVKIPELTLSSIKLKNIVIDSIAIKSANLNDRCTIKYDEIDNGIMNSVYNWGLKQCKLGDVDPSTKYIKRASISDAIVSRLVAEKIDIKLAELSESDIDPGLMDIAIKDLKRSTELYSDPQIYIYLAKVYEFKMLDEKDNDKKAILKELALEACQNAFDTDLHARYSDKISSLQKDLRDDKKSHIDDQKEGTSNTPGMKGMAKEEIKTPKNESK